MSVVRLYRWQSDWLEVDWRQFVVVMMVNSDRCPSLSAARRQLQCPT